MKAKFDHTLAYRLAVTEVAGLHLAQTHSDARLRNFVAKPVQPCRKGFVPSFVLVAQEFNHACRVA